MPGVLKEQGEGHRAWSRGSMGREQGDEAQEVQGTSSPGAAQASGLREGETWRVLRPRVMRSAFAV